MRRLEDFRNYHKGKEIWVLGCGQSLDDFPREFFDNKIAIACNWSYVAFDTTYIHIAHRCFLEFMLYYDISLFKKTILCKPKTYDKRQDNYRYLPIWIDSCEGTLVGRYHKDGKLLYELDEERAYKKAAENVESIMKGKVCKFGTFGTIIHRTIQMAAVLGAKDITLVGCEHTYPKSLDRSLSHARCLAPYYIGAIHVGIHREERYGRAQRFQRGTKFFADEFAKYGVRVRRYNYRRGYNEIS